MSGQDIAEKTQSRADLIRVVRTPLGFFVLLVLVVEALLVPLASICEGFHRTLAISGVIVILVGLIVVVAILAFFRLEALLGILADDKSQKIRLTFDSLVDIKKLNQTPITCTFVDPNDIEADQELPTRILRDDDGPFIDIRIPSAKDYVLLSFSVNGDSYSGSFSVNSRMVTLTHD